MKRNSVRRFYDDFVTDLKCTNPAKWYMMAKRIGAVDQLSLSQDQVKVAELAGLTNTQAAQKIAAHFAAISSEYSPIDNAQLPCYLPAPPPPQVEEYDVYKRLNRLKKTRSTLPIDVPEKIRRECALFLAEPVAQIINYSLVQSQYPAVWKQEWVTPVPKISHPQVIFDLRKISGTSDYNKLFEGFLKDWIMEDISKNIDIGQYGGQAGIGTEHLIVCLLDRILKLLDKHSDRSAIIMTCLDWSAAFDRQDPTLAIKRFLELGVRPSLIPLLASYLTDRKMQVKFNGELSEFFALIGGGPQGTLLGQIEYLVQSNDNANSVPVEDRFKYIDDLSILQLLCLSGLLQHYDFLNHVASDIGVDEKFIPPSTLETQKHLQYISDWTTKSQMKLNEDKCNFMVISRSEEEFSTRLTINNVKLNRVKEAKILGLYITDDLSWTRNCREICRKAYSRLPMVTRLKYVGVKIEDLLDVYKLFIRSITEYCSVAFHSSQTTEQSALLEGIQKACLKVILGDMYVDYEAALEMCGLETLASRREARCLDFALKCLKHKKNSRLFPVKQNIPACKVRDLEKFEVNFARTSAYMKSTIPYCQRLLNKHYKKET